MDDGLLPIITEFLGDLAEAVGGTVAPIKATGDAAKILLSVSDRILAYKIERFLRGVSSALQHDFVARLQNDSALRARTVEHLIIILDKIDEIEKADLIAKVFCAHGAGKIPLETFERLASAINAAFVEDLKKIESGSLSPAMLEPYLPNLLRAGLTEIVSRDEQNLSQASRGTTIYCLNHLGRIFQQIMTNQPIIG
jgi:hypothetical protein